MYGLWVSFTRIIPRHTPGQIELCPLPETKQRAVTSGGTVLLQSVCACDNVVFLCGELDRYNSFVKG